MEGGERYGEGGGREVAYVHTPHTHDLVTEMHTSL